MVATAITKSNVQRVFGTGKGSCVVLYHMNGCPHCVMMRPNWEAAVKLASKSGPHHVVEVEYGELTLLPRSLQNVRGFPTLLAIRDNQPYAEYTGDRSTESLRDFIQRYAAAPPTAPAAAPAAPPTAASKKKRATSAPAPGRKKPAVPKK